MSRIFITGDRSLGPALLPLVAVTILRNKDAEFVVGDQPGAESAARQLLELAGVEPRGLLSTPQATEESDSYPLDFAARWEIFSAAQADDLDKVYVIHGDPHSSRIYRTLLESPLADKVELVLPDVAVVV